MKITGRRTEAFAKHCWGSVASVKKMTDKNVGQKNDNTVLPRLFLANS